MAHRLTTPAGRALYALRKQMPEPVFGIIKSALGFRQFLLRGLAGARREWSLVTMAWNIKRIFACVRPDKAEVRRRRRPVPRKRHRRPLQPLSAPNPTPSAAATAKIIRGDHPQTESDRLLAIKPVVIVLDNRPIRVSKAATAARPLAHHRVTAQYAPRVNVVEPVWRDLKAHHLAHQTFTDAGDLDRAIHAAVTTS